MPQLHPVGPGRAIATRGFDRLRFGAVLLVAAVAVGSYVAWSLTVGHGIYALIVLVAGAVALTFVGGPERLARTIAVSADAIRITRFHRVGTVVERSELTTAHADVETDRKDRVRAVLVLQPHDPDEFFTRHRELRAVRRGAVAVVPAGTSPATADELTEALRVF